MLVFEKWYQEQYGRSFLYQYDDAELDKLYKAYEEYRQAFSFTMTFKEAFDFLINHTVFNGKFMSCLNIKAEEDKVLGPYLEFEVNVFGGIVGEFETYSYDPRLDVRSQTFEKGILILAELVREAYGISIVEKETYRAIPVFNGVVKGVSV